MATPGIKCKKVAGSVGLGFDHNDRNQPHAERVDRAKAWRRLSDLSEALGEGPLTEEGKGPDMDSVEFMSHFGNKLERRQANELMELAERLSYTAPGDQEAA